MMSFISSLTEVAMYALAWFLMSFGFAVVIAAAFFGIKEEKNLEESRNDL
tara:strand:- start:591 stop:740 length:150 start_codon:yes stop_codon:yes gene_type:complete